MLSVNFTDMDTCLGLIQNAKNLDDIVKITQREIERLGFTCFTYWLRWPSSENDVPLVLTTYPEHFVEHYIANDFQSHDMVGRISSEKNTPFSWSEIEKYYSITKMQKVLFDDSISAGMCSGASIPIHGPGSIQATFSVASDLGHKTFDDLFNYNRHYLHIFATYTHEKILKLGFRENRDIQLTARETEILKWVSRGKTYWEIGGILNIREDTVKKHMRSICRALQASNKAHTVAKSIIYGLIIP